MHRPGSQRVTDGLLIAAGAGLMLILLVILPPSVGIGKGTATTSLLTITTSPDSKAQVGGAFATHLLALISDNRSALSNGYAANATVEWTGQAGGEAGNFTGVGQIAIKLGMFTRDLGSVSLSNETQTIRVTSYGWVVNSTFDFSGYNPIQGKINGTVTAQDWYTQVDNLWLINRETWNFTRYYVQFPLG